MFKKIVPLFKVQAVVNAGTKWQRTCFTKTLLSQTKRNGIRIVKVLS